MIAPILDLQINNFSHVLSSTYKIEFILLNTLDFQVTTFLKSKFKFLFDVIYQSMHKMKLFKKNNKKNEIIRIDVEI